MPIFSSFRKKIIICEKGKFDYVDIGNGCWRPNGDNFEMLVTVLSVFVTNILYSLKLASSTNIQKMSPISKFCQQHWKIVTNIYVAVKLIIQTMNSICYSKAFRIIKIIIALSMRKAVFEKI